MPSPPSTPTPHRFLVRSDRPTKTDRASKDGLKISNTDSSTLRTQFNATPRFTVSSSRDQLPLVKPQSFVEPLSRRRKSRNPENDDSIVDFTAPDDSTRAVNEDLDGVDSDNMLPESRLESNDALRDVHSPASKRARIATDSGSEHRTDLKIENPGLRFKRPSKFEDDDEMTESPNLHSRPGFIAPKSPENQPPSELPAIFSPHRKSQKFVPSGLAESMRSHIMEAISEQYRVHNHHSSNGVRLTVSACSRASNATLVQCLSDQGPEENILLVGPGQDPVVGNVVLLKGVSWEVEIQSRNWVVFLDWKIER